MMDVYETIRNLCAAKGITVRDLEIQMGFSNGSISKWRNHTPSYEKVVKVANFFKVSPRILRDDVVEEYPFPTYKPLPPVLHELVSVAEGCDEEDVKLVTEILRRLADV